MAPAVERILLKENNGELHINIFYTTCGVTHDTSKKGNGDTYVLEDMLLDSGAVINFVPRSAVDSLHLKRKPALNVWKEIITAYSNVVQLKEYVNLTTWICGIPVEI